MEKLNLTSPDLVQKNIEAIAAAFPNVITEVKDAQGNLQRAVDFDLLRQELSAVLVEGDKERYQLTWPGKRQAILQANAPINKTLRPVKDDSVDWDTTQNIYLEGDNLEALKLLQESYLNKVKCIYIDPPYNTGKDFIYKDNFRQSTEEYLQESGQVDEEGNRLFQNNESNGRFHSDWLTMMYSRLKLARNLLRDDGAIFISIDKNELDNLTKVCNAIFGEDNYIATVSVVSNLKGRSDDKYIATANEFILIYHKGNFQTQGVPLPDEYFDEYTEVNAEGRYYRLQGLRKRGKGARREDRPNMFYPFFVDDKTGDIYLEDYGGLTEVVPKLSDGTYGRWRWGKDTARARLGELTARKVSGRNEWDIFEIDYAEHDGAVKRIKPKSIWTGSDFSSDAGTKNYKELLGKVGFDNPKPVALIRYCLFQAASEQDIILDFFSGSATTAHAVMQLNAEDDGNRQYIMVQLPEATAEDSEAYKVGYKNICEIGKERIRRAAKKIQEETGADIDYGFRVFRVDTGNMKDVYLSPQELHQDMFSDLTDNIKADRSGEDLLIQVVLACGLPLSLPMQTKEVMDQPVYYVAENSLVACFAEEVPEELVRLIAKDKPLRVVFRDSSFASDAARINVEEIFKALSPATEIKVL